MNDLTPREHHKRRNKKGAGRLFGISHCRPLLGPGLEVRCTFEEITLSAAAHDGPNIRQVFSRHGAMSSCKDILPDLRQHTDRNGTIGYRSILDAKRQGQFRLGLILRRQLLQHREKKIMKLSFNIAKVLREFV